ncbi:hypothetical protein GF420_13700 [candidate division GN15 bacterium]|nr:hypothetical protein [candidate division GN15 bacterium]
MKRNPSTSILFSILLFSLTLLIAGSAVADVFIRQVVHTGPVEMGGQTHPARTDTSAAWMGGDRITMITDENRSIIVRADEGKMYMVDHGAKKYAVIPIDFTSFMEEAAAASGEDVDQQQLQATKDAMKQMMGEVKVTVTETEETKKIKEWEAKKYISEISMAMGTSRSEIWATKDIDINYEMLWSASNAMMAILPGFEDMVAKMQQIEGMPIKTISTMTMMGNEMTNESEVLEVLDKPAPEGIYDIPADYAKEEFGKSMQGQMGR